MGPVFSGCIGAPQGGGRTWLGREPALILVVILVVVLHWQLEECLKAPALIAAAALGLTFLAYCATLLITPGSIEWQLQTSFASDSSDLAESGVGILYSAAKRGRAAVAATSKAAGRGKSPTRVQGRSVSKAGQAS
jgi:hypothetical protein